MNIVNDSQYGLMASEAFRYTTSEGNYRTVEVEVFEDEDILIWVDGHVGIITQDALDQVYGFCKDFKEAAANYKKDHKIGDRLNVHLEGDSMTLADLETGQGFKVSGEDLKKLVEILNDY